MTNELSSLFHMNMENISMSEMFWAMKTLSRNKAAGPDGIPIECVKDLDTDQLQVILDRINKWWSGEQIPKV